MVTKICKLYSFTGSLWSINAAEHCHLRNQTEFRMDFSGSNSYCLQCMKGIHLFILPFSTVKALPNSIQNSEATRQCLLRKFHCVTHTDTEFGFLEPCHCGVSPSTWHENVMLGLHSGGNIMDQLSHECRKLGV